jgi:hypothetical protein
MPTAKKKTTRELDVRSLARAYTDVAVRTLGGIAKEGVSESARVSAAAILLDRGWGKPNQPHTGDDGGDIRVTIRTILEGKQK